MMQGKKLSEDPEGLIERAEILRRWNVFDKTLLDIGAGPLAIIAARDFNCRVTTIDTSEDALKDVKQDAAKEGLTAKIKFEMRDATSPGYPAGRFDVVISYGALHHVEPAGRGKFIHEAYRVASKKVIIAELEEEGFDKFHGSSSTMKAVDLEWLEHELNLLGKVEKYSGTLMDVCVLCK
jgi:ubiquinone/menaquinone biosynthesis C-methylase UbiE